MTTSTNGFPLPDNSILETGLAGMTCSEISGKSV